MQTICWQFCCRFKDLKLEIFQNLQLKNTLKGIKIYDNDLFCSFYVLHGRCEEHINACKFHKFVFKLGFLQSDNHRTVACYWEEMHF